MQIHHFHSHTAPRARVGGGADDAGAALADAREPAERRARIPLAYNQPKRRAELLVSQPQLVLRRTQRERAGAVTRERARRITRCEMFQNS